MSKAAITEALVTELISSQFPQFADLPLRRVEVDGWDNTTFRLGEELSVRLPSADIYSAQVEREHAWLPLLAPQLPFSIPQPVAKGRPGSGFDRPWSIYRWLPGEPASDATVEDHVEFADDLARFMTALYEVDPTGAPLFGAHSHNRGGPLSAFDQQTKSAIAALSDEIDSEAATAVWNAAVGAGWDNPPVWVHGDITGSNLLTVRGHLRAVIDFGCSAVGDPACDLTMAWTFFSGESRAAFRAGLPVDEATWRRGGGWALWKALITLVRAQVSHPNPLTPNETTWGWRRTAREVVEEVLTSPTGLG